MKYFYKLLLLLFIFNFTSCSKKVDESILIKEQDLDLQMIESYKEGLEELNKGDVILAAQKFNEAELLYPQSIWAPKSLLMAAYSYYSQEYYPDAIYELERYFKTYPNDKNKGYASYLIAVCYYESIIDEKKDLKSIIKAKEKFNLVLNNYPKSDFVLVSKCYFSSTNTFTQRVVFVKQYFWLRPHTCRLVLGLINAHLPFVCIITRLTILL